MRRTSLRTRLLLLSIAFSVVLIGTLLWLSYIIITDAMQRTAEDSVIELAAPASRAMARHVDDAREAAETGGHGAETEQVALDHFLAGLDRLGAQWPTDAEYALYDPADAKLWSSDPQAEVPLTQERQRALKDGHTVGVTRSGQRPLTGLFGSGELGRFVMSVPVKIPVHGEAVLDVVYLPVREEAIIDAVRLPMTALAVGSAVLVVLVMQWAAGWVLALVSELRSAADSIQGGDLELQLPEPGNNEIGDLARSINALISRLRRRADAQTRFVADASHELATPVAGIRGYVNILRVWGADDSELRDEAIRAIDRESRRMARLCSELLSLIRGDRELEFRSVRFDINARCREVLADAATRHMDKDLEFIGPKEGQLMLMGDPDRIEEAIAILVDNAAKYTPVGGQVSVATRRRKDQIVVDVGDTGAGIPAEDIPYIFERFYRSDSSRSKETGGFGLGLAIAKRIVEMAGGDIGVSSASGVGTTFTVRLPRGKA